MSNEDVTRAVGECGKRMCELALRLFKSGNKCNRVDARLVYLELVHLANALVRDNFDKDPEPCPSDCGDNSCVCAYPKTGMRTNGGCRCDEGDLRRAVMFWKRRSLGR